MSDFTGKKFGRLTVIGIDDIHTRKNGARLTRLICLCECGQTKNIQPSHLRSGATSSCGCLHKERTSAAKSTHGMSASKEILSYKNMISRCFNPSSIEYHLYGGRGISVCSRWKDGEGGKTGFMCFFEDMGTRPTPKHTLDRFPDQDGNYEKDNCRWATMKEQQRNRRNNKNFEVNGRSISLAEISELSGVPYHTLYSRLFSYGWTLERCLLGTPLAISEKELAL